MLSKSKLAGLRQSLREEAEVVPILLGELDERRSQRLGRLLDELLEIDDVCGRARGVEDGLSAGFLAASSIGRPRTILVLVRLLKDLLDLLVIDEREAERVERGLDLLLVERAVAILVPARPAESNVWLRVSWVR